MISARRARRQPPADVAAGFMHRAIRLARRGEGWVEPNPMVGCVIVQRDRIMGEGFHRRFGAPHAEVEALRSCRSSPRGATVYVTLEPCCHFGKTPPCTDALIQAGVSRVIAAIADPNPLVSGRGFRNLKAAGISVETGIAAAEARMLLAPYATVFRFGRPYVIAKWAQDKAGSLVPPAGRSRWISDRTSRRHAHRLRARVDAILVGIETVLADDPLLTARDARARRIATRVVLDSRLRIPLTSRLVKTVSQAPVVVLTTRRAAHSQKAEMLRGRGVDVLTCRSKLRRVRIADGLHKLALRGMTNVMVEGGPTLLRSFFTEQLVDEAWVYSAPRVVRSANRLRGRPPLKDLLARTKPVRIESRVLDGDQFQRQVLGDVFS